MFSYLNTSRTSQTDKRDTTPQLAAYQLFAAEFPNKQIPVSLCYAGIREGQRAAFT